MRTVVLAILMSGFVWSLLIAGWMLATRRSSAVMSADERKRVVLGDGALFWRIVMKRLPQTPGGRFLVLAVLLAASALLVSAVWPR